MGTRRDSSGTPGLRNISPPMVSKLSMLHRAALATLLTSASMGRPLPAGDCVILSNEKPKPVKVVGAFCGSVTWKDYFSPGGIVVVLFDASGTRIASARSDSRGRFSFGRVPNGRYRVDVGDRDFFDEIEISNASATCRKRETLYVTPIVSECGGGGGIVRPREPDPSTVRGDGLPRQR
jgi:hypothetical protein